MQKDTNYVVRYTRCEILPKSSFTSKWRPGFLCLTNRSALAESKSYLALPSHTLTVDSLVLVSQHGLVSVRVSLHVPLRSHP